MKWVVLFALTWSLPASATSCAPDLMLDRTQAGRVLDRFITQLYRATASDQTSSASVPGSFLVRQGPDQFNDDQDLRPSLNRLIALRTFVNDPSRPGQTLLARGHEEVRAVVEMLDTAATVVKMSGDGSRPPLSHALIGAGLIGTSTALYAVAPNTHAATMVVPTYVAAYGLCFLYRPLIRCLNGPSVAEVNLEREHAFTQFVRDDLARTQRRRVFAHISLDGAVDRIYRRDPADGTPELLVISTVAE